MTVLQVAVAICSFIFFHATAREGWQHRDDSFGTRAIHVGNSHDDYFYGPVTPPIYMTSTFKQDHPGSPRTYKYGRDGNPTRHALEELLASLDKVRFGVAFPSGTAAMSSVANLLTSGDHVICTKNVFSGTMRFFKEIGQKHHGVNVTFVNMNNEEEVLSSIQPNTKMLWTESLSNPLMVITDIQKISKAVKGVNPEILVVVDNTFVSPYFSKPISNGADISIQSLSKYTNGHADVISGGATTNSERVYKQLLFYQSTIGVVPSPFDCSQVIRSIKTLHIRMNQHMINAIQVAVFLEGHPAIEKVVFPGLKSHPQHAIAKKLWSGASGMMAIYIKDAPGSEYASDIFLESLKVFTLAESLGGVQSLAELPWKMLNDDVPPEERIRLGITKNLVRLSVGIESVNSLIEDLDQALGKLSE